MTDTPSLPARASYGLSFLSPKSDWNFTIVIFVLCEPLCYAWLWYIESLQYKGYCNFLCLKKNLYPLLVAKYMYVFQVYVTRVSAITD